MPFAPIIQIQAPLPAGDTPAAIYHGALPLIISGPARSNGPKGVLDTATFEVLVDPTLADEQLAALGFAYDTKVTSADGFHSMWVRDMIEEVENSLVTRFTIELIGLLKAGDKRLRKITPERGTIYRASNTPDSPGAIIDYIGFTFTDTYFQETEPDYSVIGTGMEPTDAPAVPAILRPGTPPDGYEVGWHLGNREGEHLYGTLYKIVDTYSNAQYNSLA